MLRLVFIIFYDFSRAVEKAQLPDALCRTCVRELSLGVSAPSLGVNSPSILIFRMNDRYKAFVSGRN